MIKTTLISKFKNRDARVAIIGLGYVGLPLAVNFAQAGYEVVGIDLDQRKVDAINRGESYIEDVPSETLAALVQEPALVPATGSVAPQPAAGPASPRLWATSDFSALRE